MSTNAAPFSTRPLNVYVSPNSVAERAYRQRTGVTLAALPTDLAPGLPSTPDHDLIFHGGKTLASLTFTNFYLGGSQSWPQATVQSIDQALAAALSDPHLNNVMAQYFAGQAVTSTFRPSTILPDAAPATVSKTDVENLVGRLFEQGMLSGFDLAATVVDVMLPSGIVLNDQVAAAAGGSAPQQTQVRHRRGLSADSLRGLAADDAVDSLHGLAGYHGSVHLTAADGTQTTVYYAVGVFSETQPDGTVNGIPVFDAPWKNVVATFYHELNEARTDADVEDAIDAGNDPSAERFLGWTSQQGEECGDFPVFEAQPLTLVFQEVPLADGSGTVPVQFMYSNAVHGPEGPIDAPHPAATGG